MQLTLEQKATLEGLIDLTTLVDVVRALQEISNDKADHLIHAWQDRPSAGHWSRAGNVLAKTAERLERHDIAI